MDLSKPVRYRGFDINTATLQTGRVLKGIALEGADYSNVPSVGYMEKRAAADGMHASDVYLGPRYIDLNGLLYEPTLAELFDALHTLRAVFSPTSAYQEAPGDKGFLPLEFSQPTMDIESFPVVTNPNGISMYLLARPDANLHFTLNRDRQAQNGKGSTSIPWSARLVCKDPRVYISPGQVVNINGAAKPTQATDLFATNRGDYEAPVSIQLVITAAPGAGTFHLTGLNGIDMTITIPNTANRTYRWFGDDRVLMEQDTSGGVTDRPLTLAMGKVSFTGNNRRPMVPAAIDPTDQPFAAPYKWTCTVALAAGSRLFWSEALA